MPYVSLTIPVTLLAALKLPMRSGRSAYRASSAARCAWSMCPSASSWMTTTSAIDSRHGSSLLWCSNGPTKTTGRSGGGDLGAQPVAVVQFGRDAQAQHRHELVDRGGRAGAGEDDRVAGARAHRRPDDLAGLLAEAGRLESGTRRFRVRVRVERQDRFADVVLDEGQGAAGRRVVGVRDPACPERSGDRLIVADDRSADRLDEGRRVGHGQGQDGGTARDMHGGILDPHQAPGARQTGANRHEGRIVRMSAGPPTGPGRERRHTRREIRAWATRPRSVLRSRRRTRSRRPRPSDPQARRGAAGKRQASRLLGP